MRARVSVFLSNKHNTPYPCRRGGARARERVGPFGFEPRCMTPDAGLVTCRSAPLSSRARDPFALAGMLSGLDALEVPIGEAAREAPAEALVDPDDAGVAVNRDLVRAGREVLDDTNRLHPLVGVERAGRWWRRQ